MRSQRLHKLQVCGLLLLPVRALVLPLRAYRLLLLPHALELRLHLLADAALVEHRVGPDEQRRVCFPLSHRRRQYLSATHPQEADQRSRPRLKPLDAAQLRGEHNALGMAALPAVQHRAIQHLVQIRPQQRRVGR